MVFFLPISMCPFSICDVVCILAAHACKFLLQPHLPLSKLGTALLCKKCFNPIVTVMSALDPI